MIALVAAIPPPPFSAFHIGPLTIRMYGVMIGIGVLAAVWLTGRLFEERGIGDIDDAASIAVWGVFAGIIGARFYHVITDFQNFQNGNFIEAFKVWKPGLGIPGGIFFGTLAGVWAAKRRGIPVLPALSCAAPAIPLAQAIGRFGNYFNEELYGRPTTLPWGLEVSANVNTGFPPGTLFHPTFLYEPLWNFALCAGLVWLFHHRPRLQPGRLFPLYLIGYGVGRLWIESLRIDPANKIGPFRTNIWMSLLLIVGGATWFIMTRDSTARWPHPLRVGGHLVREGDNSSDQQPDDEHGGEKPDDSDSDRSSASATTDDGAANAVRRAADPTDEPDARSTKRGPRSHRSRSEPDAGSGAVSDRRARSTRSTSEGSDTTNSEDVKRSVAERSGTGQPDGAKRSESASRPGPGDDDSNNDEADVVDADNDDEVGIVVEVESEPDRRSVGSRDDTPTAILDPGLAITRRSAETEANRDD